MKINLFVLILLGIMVNISYINCADFRPNNYAQEEQQEQEMCVICCNQYNSIENKKITLDCDEKVEHELCYSCLVTIDKNKLRAKCPFCRQIAQIKNLPKNYLNVQLGIVASQFENNNIKHKEKKYTSQQENSYSNYSENSNNPRIRSGWEFPRRNEDENRDWASILENLESEEAEADQSEFERRQREALERFETHNIPQAPIRQSNPQPQTQAMLVRQRQKNNNIKNLLTGLILGTLTSNVQKNKYEHKNKYYSLIACAGLFDQKDSNESQILTFASSFLGGYLLEKLGSKIINKFKPE